MGFDIDDEYIIHLNNELKEFDQISLTLKEDITNLELLLSSFNIYCQKIYFDNKSINENGKFKNSKTNLKTLGSDININSNVNLNLRSSDINIKEKEYDYDKVNIMDNIDNTIDFKCNCKCKCEYCFHYVSKSFDDFQNKYISNYNDEFYIKFNQITKRIFLNAKKIHFNSLTNRNHKNLDIKDMTYSNINLSNINDKNVKESNINNNLNHVKNINYEFPNHNYKTSFSNLDNNTINHNNTSRFKLLKENLSLKLDKNHYNNDIITNIRSLSHKKEKRNYSVNIINSNLNFKSIKSNHNKNDKNNNKNQLSYYKKSERKCKNEIILKKQIIVKHENLYKHKGNVMLYGNSIKLQNINLINANRNINNQLILQSNNETETTKYIDYRNYRVRSHFKNLKDEIKNNYKTFNHNDFNSKDKEFIIKVKRNKNNNSLIKNYNRDKNKDNEKINIGTKKQDEHKGVLINHSYNFNKKDISTKLKLIKEL